MLPLRSFGGPGAGIVDPTGVGVGVGDYAALALSLYRAWIFSRSD